MVTGVRGEALVKACSPVASPQEPLPCAPFLPKLAGDEGLAMSFRAHWSPHIGTSCLPLWHRVPKGVCCTQVPIGSPCLAGVLSAGDSCILLEGTVGCHLTGSYL